MHALYCRSRQKSKERRSGRKVTDKITALQQHRSSREASNPQTAAICSPQRSSATEPPSHGQHKCVENLQNESGKLDETDEQTMPSWTFIHSSFWINLLETMKCPECGAQGLVAKAVENIGLASKIVLVCEVCDSTCAQSYTSPRLKGDEKKLPFEINQKVVEEFTSVRAGHSAVNRFCDAIGLNPMSFNIYYHHLKETRRTVHMMDPMIIEDSESSAEDVTSTKAANSMKLKLQCTPVERLPMSPVTGEQSWLSSFQKEDYLHRQ